MNCSLLLYGYTINCDNPCDLDDLTAWVPARGLDGSHFGPEKYSKNPSFDCQPPLSQHYTVGVHAISKRVYSF